MKGKTLEDLLNEPKEKRKSETTYWIGMLFRPILRGLYLGLEDSKFSDSGV